MIQFLNDLRPGQIADGDYRKAIIAVGATDGHGMHLPTGTDLYIADGIVRDIAEEFPDMLILPSIPYGVSGNHMMFPFTLSLQPETLISVLEDVLESLYVRGIYRVIIINGHNGNTAPIEIAGRRVHQRHREMKIAAMPSWWMCAERLLPSGTLSDKNGWHAGEMETAAAMAYFPELVDISCAEDCWPHLPFSPLMEMKYTIDELGRSGSVGYPSRATAESGARIREALKKEAVRYIRALDEMDWNYEGSD